MRSRNDFVKKILIITVVTIVITLIVFQIGRVRKLDKLYLDKCYGEKALVFKGVISNYKTDVLAEKSTFLIDDSVKISIPRNIKEINLNDGDTIIKIKDSNIYIVKRSIWFKWQEHKSIDTFKFDCP